MSNDDFSKYRKTFLLLPLIAVVVEIFGIQDLADRSFSGLSVDNNSVVVSIVPGSPAEQAGIRVGDRMKLHAGVDTKNTGALLRLPRATIGERRTYDFERGDSTVRVHVTFAGLPPNEVNRSVINAVLGFCLLAAGLWAYFKVPSTSSALLALVCFSAAIDFIHHPYLPSYGLRVVYMLILNMTVFFGYAMLLHLALLFPIPSPLLHRRSILRATYAPAALLTLMFLCVVIFEPERSGWLMMAAAGVYTLFFVGYLFLTVAALLRRYMRATTRERASSGLNVILLGMLIGAGPGTLAGIVRAIAPGVTLPGAEYYFLPVILIPVSFAVAMTKTRTPAPA